MTTIRNILTRPEFDQHGEFVCVRNFMHGGRQCCAGEPFDKTTVAARRLRQLYETRYIREAVDVMPPKSEKKVERVRLGK